MLVIFDTETTGVTPNSGIVELCYFIKTKQGTKEYSTLCNPGVSIPKDASRVHGIYDEHVKDSPLSMDVVSEFVNQINSEEGEIILAGHNVIFDIARVNHYLKLPDHTPLCTLSISRRLYPKSPDHRLSTLIHYLGLEDGFNAHTAMDDVRMVEVLMEKIAEDLGVDVIDLVNDEIILPYTIMPFGKYKGKAISDLPLHYLNFLLRIDLDKALRGAIKKAIDEK